MNPVIYLLCSSRDLFISRYVGVCAARGQMSRSEVRGVASGGQAGDDGEKEAGEVSQVQLLRG